MSDIDEMIEETDSDVARAIFVLAREIRSAKNMLSDFLGADAGGHLDLYVKTIADALESIANAD